MPPRLPVPAFIGTPLLPSRYHRPGPRRRLSRSVTATAPLPAAANAKTPPAPRHTPVLPAEVLLHLSRAPRAGTRGAVIVDGTVGAGGHAALLLAAPPPAVVAHYIGIDRDPVALALAADRLRPLADASGARLTLLRGDFRDVEGVLARAGLGDVVGAVSSCLLDVGVSSMQLDTADRGFSFMRDGPLDMRMDGSGGDFAQTAADLVNAADAVELTRIFREYGEERRARLMADRVVRGRPFARTLELAEALRGGEGARGRVHPATLCFQALRIAVNGELDALEAGVRGCVRLLEPGFGRLAVISFHSLEDRIVKNAFRELAAVDGGVRIVTKRPAVCGREEERANARSRSAKLRVCQRLEAGEAPRLGKVNKYPRAAADGQASAG